MIKFTDLLKKENLFISRDADNTDSFYDEVVEFLFSLNLIENKDNIKRLFVKRESIQSTAIGSSVASPHIFSEEFKEFTISVAYSPKGIDFMAADNSKVHMVFIIVSDNRDVSLHLKTLSQIANMTLKTNLMKDLDSIRTTDDLYKRIIESENTL